MENHNNIPIICICGRPNVGKSSLFNCLMRQRRAVVVEESGTTRDRVEAVVDIDEIKVKLIDTGGYLLEDKDTISLMVKDQIFGAMKEAAVLMMVVDIIDGISPADEEMALYLRKFGKPVILVANKADNDKRKVGVADFYKLGLGEPLPVSCLHRRGLADLREKIIEEMKDVEHDETEAEPDIDDDHIRVAVVGRPNVGKSSFVNNILSTNRVIVSDIPGTTRDSIDTFFQYGEDDYILIDTAGIRHKRKIKNAVDVYSIMRSKEAIAKADVAVLLLDASEGVTRDDMSILNFVEENGKACLVLINKWDMADEIEDVTQEEYEKHLLYASNHLSNFPILFVSAKTGKNIFKSLDIIKDLNSRLEMKVSTPLLNKIFEKRDPSNVPIPRRKKKPNFLYIVQSRSKPVEFKYFVNDPSLVLPAHISFIKNKLTENLELKGIPIKVIIVKSPKERKQ